MWEFIIVRNNKAPVKAVFEMLYAEELRNPSPLQKIMLDSICDGVEFIKVENQSKAVELMKNNDYLYTYDKDGVLHLKVVATK